MADYQYTYLIGNIIGLIIWIFIFLRRKDLRKEMLLLSFIFGISGLFAEIIYTKDWWQPLTITNTRIGIEDFFFGFIIGGVSAVIYSFLFNKRTKITKVKEMKEKRRDINFLMTLSLMAIITFLGFFILKFNSFVSTILAFIIPIILIYT